MLPLIWLVAGAITLVTVAVFWKEISVWLKRIYDRLPPSIQENLKGAMAFVERIDTTIKNIMVYYSYREDTQKWTETSVSREVDPSTIPSHILKRMAKTSKIDITDDLQKELVMAHSH